MSQRMPASKIQWLFDMLREGSCSDGMFGSGECSCAAGFGAASACQECDETHYGDGCTDVCDGVTKYGESAGAPCSGHGKCFNGALGNGTCVCDKNFGGFDCSLPCPVANEAVCSGHGWCRDGASQGAVCVCDPSWTGSDCTSCNRTLTGPLCTLQCLLSNRRVCNDRGSCGYVTVLGEPAASCTCLLGYVGKSCELACPGDPPCSGHGECVESSGTLSCNCYQDSVQGYWEGTSCDHCSVSYNQSTGCLKACPTNVAGEICSNVGSCLDGRCFCPRTPSFDFCGSACQNSNPRNSERTDAPCRGLYCKSYYRWGADCSKCPGYISGLTPLACSGHGFCDEGVSRNGTCRCIEGWIGDACDVSCPVGSNSLVCSGSARGSCVLSEQRTSSICTCLPLYAGPVCELNCPTVSGQVCAGHGACWNGRLGNGTCKCDVGWAGSACNVECACDSAHGECDPVACANLTVFDKCRTCKCYGNFTGLCNECKNGTQGTYCDGPCVHGRTVVKACVWRRLLLHRIVHSPVPRAAVRGDLQWARQLHVRCRRCGVLQLRRGLLRSAMSVLLHAHLVSRDGLPESAVQFPHWTVRVHELSGRALGWEDMHFL